MPYLVLILVFTGSNISELSDKCFILPCLLELLPTWFCNAVNSRVTCLYSLTTRTFSIAHPGTQTLAGIYGKGVVLA